MNKEVASPRWVTRNLSAAPEAPAHLFGLIEDMCNSNSTTIIMLLGTSPGAGKSFLLNTVMAHNRAQGHIVLSTGSTANADLTRTNFHKIL